MLEKELNTAQTESPLSNIRALILKDFHNGGLGLTEDHNYKFGYSKTGSIKFTGLYSPKYFKKETLNSYESIVIGNARLFLFTEEHEVNVSECIKYALRIFILNTEIRIAQSQEHLASLKEQLNKYLKS